MAGASYDPGAGPNVVPALVPTQVWRPLRVDDSVPTVAPQVFDHMPSKALAQLSQGGAGV